MDEFRIRPLTETDIRGIVESCGGVVAHPDWHQRAARGGDFILDGAAIELKLLDEDGLEKSERQSKLAALFHSEGFHAPVVVLDRANLSDAGQRAYDRAIEGPIKTEVASARKQLKQTRSERPETVLSILWVVNNGYTAMNHDELAALIAHRARNDTTNIDGVLVGGCYFHSDGFDHFFLWPLTYIPIRVDAFRSFDALRDAWNQFAGDFMSRAVIGELGPELLKGPVLDNQFEIDGITFVKPAPPIGGDSEFYRNGRPRKNSSGLDSCSPVALTFPGLSQAEWRKFRRALPDEFELCDGYDGWLLQEGDAREEGLPLQPFVRVQVTFDGWQRWCANENRLPSMHSIRQYANQVFQERLHAAVASAREMKQGGLLPSRYILSVTHEIGQDRANDLSHIAKVRQRLDGNADLQPIIEDVRIFHEHAIVLAGAYAVAEGIDALMWVRNRRYAWA